MTTTQATIEALLSDLEAAQKREQVLRQSLFRCITDLELYHGGKDTLTIRCARAALAATEAK